MTEHKSTKGTVCDLCGHPWPCEFALPASGAPVLIDFLPGGIMLSTVAETVETVFREVGQYWMVGAVDRDTYPYEVMITIVRRFNEP